MERARARSPIIYTNKARCRDCYRCVRACPVKAIRMADGQAYVTEERCVACGACIRECPQKAKAFRNDVEMAAGLVSSGRRVAASVAPSFAAAYSPAECRRLASALRRLGFAHVAETSVGAWQVARRTMEHIAGRGGQSHIASSCPAVVRYVERYAPERVGDLAPVVSPMVAHARHIRASGRADAVVFIGSCVAKKAEAERAEVAGAVDCVLTFAELNEWLEREKVDLGHLEESTFDEQPVGASRNFPLMGGQLKTAAITPDALAMDVLSVSGHADIERAIGLAPEARPPALLEPLFCPQGCLNGPGMCGPENLFERRTRILNYARENPGRPADEPAQPAIDCTVTFHAAPVPDDRRITEWAIRGIYEKTGKLDPQNRLNCGACGYPTCRDKAVAVLRGMAEAEMCIPYMRYLAERRTDRIIETSPNGIVIVDGNLAILSMNPAFRRLFKCSEAALGRHVSQFLDPDGFEQLASGRAERLDREASHKRAGCLLHEILYRLPDDEQFVGIFVDITETRTNREKLDHLRAETLAQTRELLEHQLRMAQQMTMFLGENTARGEELVEKLVHLVDGPAHTPAPPQPSGGG